MVPPAAAGRQHLPRRTALYESRREREFYRYYEPIRSLTQHGPPLCNLKDAESVRNHQPASSPDRALTAFCQLGALRLGTRRAMLFFFDSEYAYVLAEATRSLSLQNDEIHEIEDDLWLGHCIIPRGYSICEETVCRLPEPEDQSAGQDNRDMIHIINDLEKDTHFCGRPYVTDGPKARFYAGVPITTPNGINIGAYCCLDDRKRDGLDEKNINFMKDMASTIMTHLQMVRARAEHERGTRMISGLGAFIEGASGLRTWEQGSHSRDRRKMGESRSRSRSGSPTPKALAAHPNSTEDGAPLSLETPTDASIRQSVSGESVPTVSDVSGTRDARRAPASDSQQAATSRAARTSRQAKDVPDQSVASNVRTTFERAAQVVREAVDVDGCVYLDATVGAYGGLVEIHTNAGSDQSSDAMFSGPEAAGTGTDSEGRRSVKGNGDPDSVCKVLASSHTSHDPYSSSEEFQRVASSTTVTEKFLRCLLRRYPRGKIWNFNQQGDASSDDDSSEGGFGRADPSQSDASEGLSTRPSGRRYGRIRVDDGKDIQRLFPGVRSLALVGMWDQSKGRWYAATAVWTYSALRLFSQETEVTYLSAFNDVVVAEVHRIEAQDSDSAKSDFIGSISHELRSPLHGILGSVECLQEQEIDSFSTSLTSQIEICGRTLLEIVENLLDFSKINNATRSKTASAEHGVRRRLRPGAAKASQQLGSTLAQDVDVSLDVITEEVVETAVYSFCCSKDKQLILDRKVAVVMDIDRASEGNWRCRLPVGGWKRICINLVSNALKYTTAGFITVSLKAEPIPGKRRRFNAVLSVSDTGRGMSKDFLENHLFRAFSQEDTLVEGTGLGMSLVAKIIRAMGGKIEVQSEKGIGTTMIVTVPIEHNRSEKTDPVPAQHRRLEGTSLGILGFQDANHSLEAVYKEGRNRLLRNVENCCAHLGLQSRRISWSLEPRSDVYLIAEIDLTSYGEELRARRSEAASESRRPIIVLCDSAISQRQLKAGSKALGLVPSEVEFISQPCSPQRLAKAIEACLDGAAQDNGHEQGERHTTAGAVSGVANLAEWVSPSSSPERDSPPLPTRHSKIVTRRDSSSAPGLHSTKPDKTVRLTTGLGRPLLSRNRSSFTKHEALSDRAKSVGGRPQSPPSVDVVPLKRPSAQRTASQGSKDALSLLLVDDNQINLQLLVHYARKQGHHKMTATDGAQAVEAYKSACQQGNSVASDSEKGVTESPKYVGKPQVVLMDINMPVLDGFEATRMIRAFERQHSLQPAHVIALTGLGSASAQQEAFSSGVDLFLTKPVRLKELTKVLDEIRNAESGGLAG